MKGLIIHLSRIYCVPSISCTLLSHLTHQNPIIVDTIDIPILHMRKTRLRVGRHLPMLPLPVNRGVPVCPTKSTPFPLCFGFVYKLGTNGFNSEFHRLQFSFLPNILFEFLSSVGSSSSTSFN